jgi:pyridoxal phosphate enzyme (YggS family)
MTTVAEGLAAVRLRIANAAAAAGRDPSTIRLVAASKGQTAEAIREAFTAGHRAFGENYAQELWSKAEALGDLAIEWHFIGHLQTNKVKLVAPVVSTVETIDAPRLAREIARRAAHEGKRVRALVEVSVAGEAQKSGVAPQDLGEVLAAIEREPALELRGLMTMPPYGDLAIAKKTFDALASLRNLHGGAARLPELSMGMSTDLEVAIASGATIVRVGTAIFGER